MPEYDLEGLRVFVYYNLHKQCWSVKALEGEHKGRVVRHCASVGLEGASGRVGQKGRLRVIREGRKNVHAGIVGRVVAISQHPVAVTSELWREVTYNPFKYKSFVYKDNESAFPGHAEQCLMVEKRVYV